MNYYVYMLLCSDNSFYVGITNDLERRVGEHQYGFDERCYTYTRRPVQLVYASDFQSVADAITWEKRLKSWSRTKKAALVRNDWQGIHEAAKCKNATASDVRGTAPLDFARDDECGPSTSLGVTISGPSTTLGVTKLRSG
jgi:putative endonuclease